MGDVSEATARRQHKRFDQTSGNRTLLKLYDDLAARGEGKRRLPGKIGKTFAGKDWPTLGISKMIDARSITRRLRPICEFA